MKQHELSQMKRMIFKKGDSVMLRDILSYAIIYVLVWLVWCGLESLIYGEIQPRVVDDIVSLLLSISIFSQYKSNTERKG